MLGIECKSSGRAATVLTTEPPLLSHLWTRAHWQLQEAGLEAKLAALSLELSWTLSLGIQPLALGCTGLSRGELQGEKRLSAKGTREFQEETWREVGND